VTARDKILKRRAKLVAAALASAGIAAGACGPTVCLSIVDPDASTTKDGPSDGSMMDTKPQVCLTMMQEDSGVDTGRDSPSDAPDDRAEGG
jgi:hypothetical protein